jgi:hypothetical protein
MKVIWILNCWSPLELIKWSQLMLSITVVEISGGDQGDIMSSYLSIYYFELLLSLYVYITYVSI